MSSPPLAVAQIFRGEFAFLVAETLRSTEFVSFGVPFLSSDAFSVAVWALLIATIVAPIAFGFVLASQQRLEKGDDADVRQNSMLPRSKPSFAVSRAFSKIFVGDRQSVPVSRYWIKVGTDIQVLKMLWLF